MILCAGESLIDMVPREGAFLPLPGGAVYNTAIALGRLGAQSAYLWPLSTDPFGEILRAPLREAKVSTALCPESPRPTTLAFVTLKGGEAHYSFYDEGSAGRMFSPEDLPNLPENLTALFIGGISLVPEPCASTIETLVHRARDRGIAVMLDPNIRPFFITEIPDYRARIDRLIRLADVVKLSADDLAWLWPAADPDELLPDLLNRGPKLIFRTLGGQGAEAWHRSGRVPVPAQSVRVADTIGAGDTFNAGILAALDRAGALPKGLDRLDPATIRKALDLGTRAAAITVARAGANPPWAHEL